MQKQGKRKAKRMKRHTWKDYEVALLQGVVTETKVDGWPVLQEKMVKKAARALGEAICIFSFARGSTMDFHL